MSFNQALADRQTQARSTGEVGRVVPVLNAVELVKDVCKISQRDAQATIGDTHDGLLTFPVRRHFNG